MLSERIMNNSPSLLTLIKKKIIERRLLCARFFNFLLSSISFLPFSLSQQSHLADAVVSLFP